MSNSQTHSSTRDRSSSTPGNMPQGLPSAEIESLLRSARKNLERPTTFESDEELGPGDVQYLRGNSMTRSKPPIETSAIASWPDASSTPDSRLRQAEQHLAEAILDSTQVSWEPAQRREEDASEPIPSPARSAPANRLTLDDLGDVDLEISIELGRAEILIEDVLKLREGSVVALDRLAGDPIDIVANGHLIARGELIVIDGKFGVRLSEVL